MTKVFFLTDDIDGMEYQLIVRAIARSVTMFKNEVHIVYTPNGWIHIDQYSRYAKGSLVK